MVTTITNYTSEALERLTKNDFRSLTSEFINKVFQNNGQKYTPSYNLLMKVQNLHSAGDNNNNNNNNNNNKQKEDIKLIDPYYPGTYNVFLVKDRSSDFFPEHQHNKQLLAEVEDIVEQTVAAANRRHSPRKTNVESPPQPKDPKKRRSERLSQRILAKERRIQTTETKRTDPSWSPFVC